MCLGIEHKVRAQEGLKYCQSSKCVCVWAHWWVVRHGAVHLIITITKFRPETMVGFLRYTWFFYVRSPSLIIDFLFFYF